MTKGIVLFCASATLMFSNSSHALLSMGGISGGGGNVIYATAPAKPHDVSFVETRIKTAKPVVLEYLSQKEQQYRGGGMDSNQAAVFAPLFSKNHQVSEKAANIELKVKTTESCFDQKGHEFDGSILATDVDDVCMSAKRIAEKVELTELDAQSAALMIHEFIEFFGLSDEEAIQIQVLALGHFQAPAPASVTSTANGLTLDQELCIAVKSLFGRDDYTPRATVQDIKILIEKGANPNSACIDVDGRTHHLSTPMHLAVSKSHAISDAEEVALFMLGLSNPVPDIRSFDGQSNYNVHEVTPFMTTALFGASQTVFDKVLALNPDLNLKSQRETHYPDGRIFVDYSSIKTPLGAAIWASLWQRAEQLVLAGSDCSDIGYYYIPGQGLMPHVSALAQATDVGAPTGFLDFLKAQGCH
ncbi:MAG: hypothetical protein KF802_04565 [Bdellovibrionaceae bacterium]|nr:hypothetical protein [Pseudobdellovibrionaceae bacterium]